MVVLETELCLFSAMLVLQKAIAVDEILRILISRPSVSPVATC